MRLPVSLCAEGDRLSAQTPTAPDGAGAVSTFVRLGKVCLEATIRHCEGIRQYGITWASTHGRRR